MGRDAHRVTDAQSDQSPLAAILWGVVVALVTALLGAFLLALGLLFFERLQPTLSVFLAVALAAAAFGALWSSHRVGRGGLWVGAATGLTYALVAWGLSALLGLGPFQALGLLQALASAVVLGGVAGIIGVNL